MMHLNGSEELERFYKNKFYFSYSGLNKLLYSPGLFYNHYVLNQREDSTDPHLVGGRVLHCLLFEPEKYDDYFKKYPLVYKQVMKGAGPFTLDGRDEADMKKIIAQNIAHVNQERVQKLLFKMLEENIRGWWD